MQTFEEWVCEGKLNKEIITESDDESILLIKLEDGNMKVVSTIVGETKPGSFGSEKYEHTITYNGLKTKFITNVDYEVISFKGQALDALTLFNHLIQQFNTYGTVKSK